LLLLFDYSLITNGTNETGHLQIFPVRNMGYKGRRIIRVEANNEAFLALLKVIVQSPELLQHFCSL